MGVMSRHDASGLTRRALLGGGIALAWFAASAHTPYRQWRVYRQRHLMIVASKTDPEGFRLSRAVAETLAEHLPDSHARPSRAPSAARVASLLGTGQMDVAVLPRAEAAALRAGDDPFRESGPVDLEALFDLGDHLLVCRAEFPEEHAFLVVQTLYRNRAALAHAGARLPVAGHGPLPPHPGVMEFVETVDRAG